MAVLPGICLTWPETSKLSFHSYFQVNVFVLGRTYLCLAKELCINMPEIGEYTSLLALLLEGCKTFLCSTQLSMKFKPHKNVKGGRTGAVVSVADY